MDQSKPARITDEKTALAKAEHYCAYQERSQQEVRDKLYEWGLYPNIIENVIVQLIAGNFLNEERFANAYARGKFNQKGWGKNRIKQGLKFKRVSDVLIRKALNSINSDDYSKMLEQVLQKKATFLNEKDPYKRKYKLQQYALSRGYENDIISDVLKNSDL
ncbi:MAG TPA: RecX family transcriptional regulator [Mucilaginibacter sp.]|nr:RecX family transcriptional regulator [Mucilaginibacter sp.]